MWSITLPGDQNGRYYTYTVQIDGKTQETGDPYAVAAGVNGLRSMVLDLDAAAPAGWQDDRRPDIPPQKRVVWEVSVRDFSQDAASGVRPDWRGKFLAFTQPGTTCAGTAPTHLPELPAAAGCGLCPDHADVRFRQCGRSKTADETIQLGL